MLRQEREKSVPVLTVIAPSQSHIITETYLRGTADENTLDTSDAELPFTCSLSQTTAGTQKANVSAAGQPNKIFFCSSSSQKTEFYLK